MATMLYAKEVPLAGSDLFASLTLAYEALSEGMKAMVGQKLSTVNQYDKQATRSRRMSGKFRIRVSPRVATHPLVRVHPETNKPALYLNAMQTTRHFAGMTLTALIAYLLDHATRQNSRAGFVGVRALSACGTTDAFSTWRSTTTLTIAG